MANETLKIGSTVLDAYISGYQVDNYDLSASDTTRNAKGDLIYKIINNKYKLFVETRHLTQAELTAFLTPISPSPIVALSVTFYNPYTGSTTTKNMYRGDRSVALYWDTTEKGKLFQPFKIELIEL